MVRWPIALFSLLLGAALYGCAASNDGLIRREWRENAQRPVPVSEAASVGTLDQDNSPTLGIASLFSVEMTLLGECDSCHGASPNFWEFEYDNKLDSIAQLLYPEMRILRLVPDVPPFAESDTLLDSLTFRLSRSTALGWDLCDRTQEEQTVLFSPSPEDLDILNQLSAHFGIDLLLLPGSTQVRLTPDGNRPKGSVEVDHLFAVWDLRSRELLYRSCQQRRWITRGDEQIDRQTTPRVLDPLSVDLRKLRFSR